jgi:hypothetical protein
VEFLEEAFGEVEGAGFAGVPDGAGVEDVVAEAVAVVVADVEADGGVVREGAVKGVFEVVGGLGPDDADVAAVALEVVEDVGGVGAGAVESGLGEDAGEIEDAGGA